MALIEADADFRASVQDGPGGAVRQQHGQQQRSRGADPMAGTGSAATTSGRWYVWLAPIVLQGVAAAVYVRWTSADLQARIRRQEEMQRALRDVLQTTSQQLAETTQQLDDTQQMLQQSTSSLDGALKLLQRSSVQAQKRQQANTQEVQQQTQQLQDRLTESLQEAQESAANMRAQMAEAAAPRARVAAFSMLVPDYDSAIAFFVEVCGFELTEDRDEGRKRWVTVRPPGAETQIVLARADTEGQRAAMGQQLGGRVGFFLHTDDFSRDHARMKAGGVKFREEPRREAYGVVAVWEDPWGNAWDLLEPT